MDPEEGLRLLVAEYSRMAAAYDRDYAPYHAPMVRSVLDLARLASGEKVLDVGCGTGVLTFEIAQRIGEVGSVVGIDLAVGTINIASVKSARIGASNARFEQMDARKLAFADSAFDAVLSCFGIASLGHERAFREVYRVLREDGRFVMCHWSGESKGPSVVGLLAKFRPKDPPEEVQRLLEARRSINATGEAAALGTPETVVKSLRTVGFRDVSVVTRPELVVYPDPDAYLTRGLAMGDNEREFRHMTQATREGFLKEFMEEAVPFVKDDGLGVIAGVAYFVARK